jgi:hypothetical protein
MKSQRQQRDEHFDDEEEEKKSDNEDDQEGDKLEDDAVDLSTVKSRFDTTSTRVSQASSSLPSSSSRPRQRSSVQPRNGRPDMIKTASISMYHGEGFEVGQESAFDMYSPENNYMEHYDPWMFTELDEDGHRRRSDTIRILGTSADDPAAEPHVLSPILMQSFQEHLPYSKRGESFWLKYSLVRDGASSISFLQHLRGSKYTLMAMETVDGEVFGAFCVHPWLVQPSYFGTGETFLWRMKHSRILENGEQYHNGTLQEQIQHEAEIDVFPATNHTGNPFYQLCQRDKIAVGGGVCSTPHEFGSKTYNPQDIGFAIVFNDGDLMYGSSSACLTFESPPLSKHHGKKSTGFLIVLKCHSCCNDRQPQPLYCPYSRSLVLADGSKFELVNLEVWSLTPCLTLEEAQMMENRHLFLKRNTTI